MACFVLTGMPDCKNFIHALYVCHYLEEHLPDFRLCTIEKHKDEWGPFLDFTNKKYGWHHRTSPLIWKELCYRGGTAYLIGGLSEFWEYCYDYYSLSSNISFNELIKLVEDHLQQIKKQETAEVTDETLNICISGASNPILRLLLVELTKIDYSPKPREISVKLFDHYSEKKENAPFIKTIMGEFLVLESSYNKTIELVQVIGDGLKECDLFIIADWFKPGTINDFNDKLVKKMSMMLLYADVINAFGKRSLKVVVADDGPVCFNATVLIETCTRIRIANIVAVTSDIGLSHLTEVAYQTGIPVRHLGGPPVWGFVGVNEFVDLDNIIHYSEVYVPYSRSLQAVKDSTLPPGKMKPELRFIAYLLEENEAKLKAVKRRQAEISRRLGIQPAYAKTRAIVSLLSLWYAKEHKDDIISLGVCSNGAFGFPNGIVFSQPSYLNKQRMWVPFKRFPITDKTREEIEKLIAPAQELLDEYGVSRKELQPSYSYI